MPVALRSCLALFATLAVACSSPPPPAPTSSAPATTQPGAAVTPPPSGTTAPPATTSVASSAPAPASAPLDDAARATSFPAKAYAAAAAKEKGNVFLSPPSLRLALGIVYAGAAGETAREMQRALELDPDPARAVDAARAEGAAWAAANGKNVSLSVANRLWGDKAYTFEAPFLDRVKAGWGAGLEQVDFQKAAEASRGTINGWVKRETKDRIPELLPKGSLSDRTRLVITNAIHFDGKWLTPFDAKDTKPAPFFIGGGEKATNVPTMRRTMTIPSADVGDARLAELAYSDGVAMVVALPAAKDGLAKLEAQLGADTFATWTKKLAGSGERLDVALPSFELRWGGSVKALLGGLGIARLFSNDAELTGIGKANDLKVDEVFHKTFVKVDEKGTEAAAATGVVIGIKSMPAPPQPFVVDRPFLFYLVDKKAGRVLFVGRVTDPTQKGQ